MEMTLTRMIKGRFKDMKLISMSMKEIFHKLEITPIMADITKMQTLVMNNNNKSKDL